MTCGVDTEGSSKPSEGLTRLFEATGTEPSRDRDNIVDDVLLDTERLWSSLSGAQTERPVDEIEYEEQQGEYNQEHFIYLGTKT